MKYLDVLTNRAHADLDAAYSWWAENRSREQAEKWYNKFADAIESLDDEPDRYPLSYENNQFPFPIRDLRFGVGKRPTHRAVFTIRTDMVLVLAIRHLAQRAITPDEL
jgi:plasmid stabilization system protein ParE